MSILINLFFFALVLSLIVFIHELGHFMTAKWFGVYVNEFAIGMGPKVFQYKPKNNETTFSIRALPLGGFVSMAGEPGEADFDVPVERSIAGIAHWKRLIIMLAGIFMNFVLAFVIFWGMFTVLGTTLPQPAIISSVMEGSPAMAANLQKDDKIQSITFFDGSTLEVNTFNDLTMGVLTYEGKPMTLSIDRAGETLSVELTPKFDETNQRYLVGVTPYPAESKALSIFSSIPVAFGAIGAYIGQLGFVLMRLIRGVGLNAISGPIGIYQATSDVATYGAPYFFMLTASMSVSLAIMNLLPIPILDGGRALMTIIEMIIGREIPEEIQNKIMIASITLMAVLFVFIMYNDIRKFF